MTDPVPTPGARDILQNIWDHALADVPCRARRNIGYEPFEAFRLAVPNIIKLIAEASDTFSSVAGVGGVETAGSLISYLAANPSKIDLFLQDGVLALMDDAPDGARGFHAHGCLTWHRGGDGKVVTPQDLRISLTVRDMAKGPLNAQ